MLATMEYLSLKVMSNGLALSSASIYKAHKLAMECSLGYLEQGW